ncbi:MAG: urea ABC transporter ATP-binding subunit UrtE [Pseudomonadota bacterium]
MLDAKDITLHYSGSQILYGVDITADVGAVTCVMGVNGVGKTSLLKAIAGLHPRSGGTITLAGEALPKLSPQALAKRGVAIVPQGRDVFPLMTVRENLETGFACLPRGERRVPDAIFDLFPILSTMQNRRGGDLSGGQQQQLAIARALVTRPKLLLMDEPTEGIQPSIIADIGRVIAHLREERQMAIVLVEQFFRFAYDLADRFVVLERGAVTLSGEKSALSKDALYEAVSV